MRLPRAVLPAHPAPAKKKIESKAGFYLEEISAAVACLGKWIPLRNWDVPGQVPLRASFTRTGAQTQYVAREMVVRCG